MIELSKEKPVEDTMRKLIQWLNDPVLMKYSEQRHREHTTKSQLEYYYDSMISSNIYRIIRYKGTFIGTVTASLDNKNSIANVGILIGSEYTGKGHGCAVWGVFCHQLAKDGIRKIEAGCMSQNKPMIRIFEKNGMRLEGTRRYHFRLSPNEYDDLILYGKLT